MALRGSWEVVIVDGELQLGVPVRVNAHQSNAYESTTSQDSMHHKYTHEL